VSSELRGPGDVFERIVHGVCEARCVRRTLRSKLSSGGKVNNGTGGQQHCFLPANPVGSIRLEELLVRSACSNPVRKNRGQRGWLSQALTQVVPERHPGSKRRVPEEPSGLEKG
jgi:hypothetical protein